MAQFLIDAGQWGLVCAAVLVLVCAAAGNGIVARSQAGVVHALGNSLNASLSVDRVYYEFPNSLVVHHANLTTSSGVRPSLDISRLILKFSVVQLVRTGRFYISYVHLDGGDIHENEFRNYLLENYPAVKKFLGDLPRGKVRLILDSVRFHPAYNPSEFFTLNFSGTIDKQVIDGKGYLASRRPSLQEIIRHGDLGRFRPPVPFEYSLHGELHSDGIKLQRFAMHGDKFHTEISLEWIKDALQINGFAMMDPPPIPQPPALKGFFAWMVSLVYSRQELTRTALPQNGFYILDLAGQFILKSHQIEIQNLKFNMDNMPVSVSGEGDWQGTPSARLKVSILPSADIKMNWPSLERVEADVTAQWQNPRLQMDGEVAVYFLSPARPSHFPQKIVASVDDFQLSRDADAHWKLAMEKADVMFWANGKEHSFQVAGLSAMIEQRNEWITLLTMNAPFYDGLLHGKIWLDRSEAPARIISQLKLTNVDSHQLDKLIVHFAKVRGALSSDIRFTSYPRFSLTGEINLQDGNLQNYDFFNWLADSFDLLPLKSLDFEQATVKFLVNSREAALKNIHLKADRMDLDGFYSVDADGLVSSRLGLNFHRDLLGESRKFRPLLRMFDPGEAKLKFDFQLSGNEHAMNFQWLPSPVKEKIQEKMPDFIERKIERSVAQDLEAVPQNSPVPAEEGVSSDINN